MATDATNSGDAGDIHIRPAAPDDCEEIMHLIMELAVFEKMADQVNINADTLRKDCFGEQPKCYCLVAEQIPNESKKLIGYALYFTTYSTWEGVCVHLEDLYVSPPFRGQRLGKKLWQEVAKATLDMGCSRLQLCVLGWNKQAKDWYERAGCINLTETEEWNLMRLTKDGMEKFVKS